jgi:predicted MFS family arabinose efflux permease
VLWRTRSAVVDTKEADIKHRRRSTRFAPLRHEDYRRIWTANFISELGDAMGRVALTVLIQRETGSAILTGSVLATAALPNIGLGQWITAKVAHLPRRNVLLVADCLRACCYAAMVLPIGIYPRLALLFVASVATPPFNAVAGALAARTVPRELIGAAAGLRTGTTEFAFVVGFALGGILTDVVSPDAVLAIDAMTFVLSAAIITRLPATGAVGASGQLRFGDGLRAISADAREEFPDAVGATGALPAIVAIGVILATALPREENDDALLRHAGFLTITGAAISTAAFAGPNRLVVVGLAYLAIGPVLAIRVHQYSILSRRVDDLYLAPAISVSGGAISISYLVAGLGGGALAEALGADVAFTIITAGAVLVGALSLLRPVRPDSGEGREIQADRRRPQHASDVVGLGRMAE